MAAEQKEYTLPPYYRDPAGSFKKTAQRLDPDHVHRWVKVGAENEMDRASKGWIPVEDATELKRLGLGSIIAANGRARSGELELWRMPRGQAKLIQRHLQEKAAEKSTMLKAQLESLQAETIGRSGGKVIPTFTYGPAQDILERQPLALPKTGPAKKE